MDEVCFAELDENTLGELLYLAMTDAEPSDVMAPMPGDPGWTPERTELFLEGHRRCRRGPDEANRQVTMAVIHNGAVAGSVRFEPIEDGGACREIGLWLSRTHRGHGISTRVLQLGAEFARDELDAREVFANTSVTNRARRDRAAPCRLRRRAPARRTGVGHAPAQVLAATRVLTAGMTRSP